MIGLSRRQSSTQPVKKVVRAALLAATFGLLGICALAQTFTKAIRVVVPYPAGDLADIIADRWSKLIYNLKLEAK
jgi:tripartite-type tricarboxylate transporter receptor subunit TctC